MNQAILTNKNDYTIFRYGDRTIRFKSPYSLEYYSKVVKWDRGYLVVMAKYRQNLIDEEEYIDLVPILSDLFIEPNEFLSPIKEVIVQND